MRPTMLLAVIALLLPMSAMAGEKQLWLIGGGEPICSSVEPQFCLPEKRTAAEALFTRTQALRGRQFRYQESGRNQIAAFPSWTGGEPRRRALLAGLDALRPRLQGRTIAESEWHALLGGLGLGEEELGLVDDIFETRALRDDGSTRKAVVFLDGSAGYVQALFRDFVAAAGAERKRRQLPGKPRILFLTASSTNPFADVDYYSSLFEAAGADVQWLPLEPAVAHAADCRDLEPSRMAWNGVWGRAAINPEWAGVQRDLCLHPERMRLLVDGADGYFINGGDQSLTMRSLQVDGRFTPLAQRLLNRVESGVPLAGSSAGTAVQSGDRTGTIPMLSNGTSARGLRFGALAVEANAQLCDMNQTCTFDGSPDDLTYLAHGGLRTFTLGVVDTHFRERDREGRLVRLLLDTHTRFGFGVDEATALKIDFVAGDVARLQVLGKGGVWIVDTDGATSAASEHAWQASGFHVSRLLAGDSAQLRRGVLDVSLDCASGQSLPDAPLADGSTYDAVDGRSWTRLPSAQPIPGCPRADGRWRYARLPLQLTQEK